MQTTIKVTSPKGFTVVIGQLEKNDMGIIFTKKVKRSKHFMRRVSGYGIQKEAFDQYLRGKLGVIEIVETDTKKTLVASIGVWEEHGSHQNFGFGRQVFLSEKYMEVK